MSNGVRWTNEQYEAHQARVNRQMRAMVDAMPIAKKPTKFHSVPTNGHASKREAKRAAELRLLEKAGQIRDLREQVEYTLIPKQDGERACKYVADFVYFVYRQMTTNGSEWGWREVVEDCKGYRTPVYRLKRKLMLHVHGIRVRET